MPARTPIDPSEDAERDDDIGLQEDDAGGTGDLPLDEIDDLDDEITDDDLDEELTDDDVDDLSEDELDELDEEDDEVEIDRDVELESIGAEGGAEDDDEFDDDDDNPYGDSDEALPDDAEESALSRDPSLSEGRFGQA